MPYKCLVFVCYLIRLLAVRIMPEVSIKTPCAPGESPRMQRQERNFKEDKLNCEVYTEDGE